ncbi:MAG: imidazolonepropionase [Candidatus Promineifilaceae bacterium]|jgi:imidazolonepropionase
MSEIDLLILNAAQVVTCAGNGPKRGAAMQNLNLIPSGLMENGAVAIDGGVITAVGSSAELQARFQPAAIIDAAGKAVCPGFVDPHTHTVFAGDRAHEFELRIKGATYMEIMAAGGGILSTMRHTRAASVDELVALAARRLDEMLALGSTTVEIKTGYGLDLDTELKMLEVIARLDQEHPCDIVPTFLGAHTVPPEFGGNAEGYVDLVVQEMVPAAAEWYQNSHFAAQETPFFIDVFCEDHAFTVDQSRRILSAGIEAGMQAKIHVDQFNALGGLSMAVELGAVSADHLDYSSPDEIKILAASDTIATPLPAVNFNLGLNHYADARSMLDDGAVVALATDFNPGSAPCLSMPFVMAAACRYQKMLPSEALNAATINAAHAVGLGSRVGSIEVGKQADLLILKEGDYRHIAYYFGHNPIDMVIKNGLIV